MKCPFCEKEFVQKRYNIGFAGDEYSWVCSDCDITISAHSLENLLKIAAEISFVKIQKKEEVENKKE